jgi:hypothetical protein
MTYRLQLAFSNGHFSLLSTFMSLRPVYLLQFFLEYVTDEVKDRLWCHHPAGPSPTSIPLRESLLV